MEKDMLEGLKQQERMQFLKKPLETPFPGATSNLHIGLDTFNNESLNAQFKSSSMLYNLGLSKFSSRTNKHKLRALPSKREDTYTYVRGEDEFSLEGC